MEIKDFTEDCLEAATKIATESYNSERAVVDILPDIPVPKLNEFAQNGLGAAAFEDGKLVGYLCCFEPWDNAFDTVARGTFSPVHAHGAVGTDRGLIFGRLYQYAAEKWVSRGILYHAISFYAHDEESLGAMFSCGFGLRCLDAIRGINPIECKPCTDIEIKLLAKDEVCAVRKLRIALSEHFGNSPCFMYSTDEECCESVDNAEKNDSNVYAAMKNGEAVAFLQLEDGGENFVTYTSGLKSIHGAYCLPEYRGRNIMPSLINFALDDLKKCGYNRIGVDFESINPVAMSAWCKYFTPYTKSVTRRIDEGIMRKFRK